MIFWPQYRFKSFLVFNRMTPTVGMFPVLILSYLVFLQILSKWNRGRQVFSETRLLSSTFFILHQSLNGEII
jgi:hypothetical protein